MNAHMPIVVTRFGKVRVARSSDFAQASKKIRAQRPVVLVGDDRDPASLTIEQIEDLLEVMESRS